MSALGTGFVAPMSFCIAYARATWDAALVLAERERPELLRSSRMRRRSSSSDGSGERSGAVRIAGGARGAARATARGSCGALRPLRSAGGSARAGALASAAAAAARSSASGAASMGGCACTSLGATSAWRTRSRRGEMRRTSRCVAARRSRAIASTRVAELSGAPPAACAGGDSAVSPAMYGSTLMSSSEPTPKFGARSSSDGRMRSIPAAAERGATLRRGRCALRLRLRRRPSAAGQCCESGRPSRSGTEHGLAGRRQPQSGSACSCSCHAHAFVATGRSWGDGALARAWARRDGRTRTCACGRRSMCSSGSSSWA